MDQHDYADLLQVLAERRSRFEALKSAEADAVALRGKADQAVIDAVAARKAAYQDVQDTLAKITAASAA